MKTFFIKALITSVTFCLLSSSFCRAQIDELGGQNVLLDSAVVSVRRHTTVLKQTSPGSYKWDMQQLDFLPKIMGNADPIHYAQMLPGVQTNSEYRSGINIDGCDNSQSVLTLGGVPVYNVGHLLGLFSVFNGSHFKSMSISRSPSDAAFPNFVGGKLDMQPFQTTLDTVSGELSIGLISSQGTVRMPLGKRTSVVVSLRGSYVNLLYGHWLKADDAQMTYSFGDANVSIVHQLGKCDRLLGDFYWGTDKAKFNDSHYLADVKATWGNTMGALHWLRDREAWHMRHTLYVTDYHNHFSLQMEEALGNMPSRITDIGLKSTSTWHRLSFGGNVIAHMIKPQCVNVDDYYAEVSSVPNKQTAIEASAYADWNQPISSSLAVNAGTRFTLWHVDNQWLKSVDPSLSLQYKGQWIKLSATWFMRHQYMFQTGFSDAGLPTEFWVASNNRHAPQHCNGLSVGASADLGRCMWRLSADVFFRRMSRQVEYSGSLLDCLNASYDFNDYLLHGKGRNVGFNVMIQKCAGQFTGWVSYTFTKARRTFTEEGYDMTYPANHNRPHELNAVLAWALGKHWVLGATMVYASGTPFTAPVSASILNGNIIANYGPHNGNRLGDYARLDLSVNYRWKSRRFREHGVNLSIYNATAHRNDLFYQIRTKKDGSFAMRPVTFMVDVLPSVSYYCKF